jgi:hypothetical protein
VSQRKTLGKLSVPLLVPGVFSRTWTVIDFKVCYLCNVAFVACNKSNITEIAWDECDIAAISAILLQSLQHCSNVTFVACNLCNNCNIAEIAWGMKQMQHRVILPSSAFDIITWMSSTVTMAATMTRIIPFIIEGQRRWRVVAIATLKVIVARPATVVASFLFKAGFKARDGGGTHIQPPP